jgi:uncharacterized membrane protein YeaQ/YmgE (transglycosylase-associated protein family)
MTWVDLALVTIVASTTALGADRRLSGLMVGAGGVLVLRPLLELAQVQPWLGLLGALVAGLLLALLGRQLLPAGRRGMRVTRLLGGFGGAALGVAIVLTLVTSLPVQRNPVEPGLIYYPPRDLPHSLQRPVAESALVGWGRSVLLFPLLDAQGAVPAGERAALSALHAWVVVGEPWRVAARAAP